MSVVNVVDGLQFTWFLCSGFLTRSFLYLRNVGFGTSINGIECKHSKLGEVCTQRIMKHTHLSQLNVRAKYLSVKFCGVVYSQLLLLLM